MRKKNLQENFNLLGLAIFFNNSSYIIYPKKKKEKKKKKNLWESWNRFKEMWSTWVEE